MRIRRSVKQLLRKAWFDKQEHTHHFIHIPKNGGSSLREALAVVGEVSLSEPYHYRYVDIADKVGRDLRFFCTIRNPWSRTASRYMFGKQNAARWSVGDPRREYIETASFEDFVRDRKLLPIPQHPDQPWMGPLSSWYNQLEWIRDEEGNVACDCLRLECIDADISRYLRRDLVVPRTNVTGTRYDYRAMYTEELHDLVAAMFKDDIEYFGFTFEGPAIRNIAFPD